MSVSVQEHRFIDTFEDLESFYEENKSVEWMGFDTEFVGEKRYFTLLCLIQVSTTNGYYLIDPIKLDDLGPFLALIKDPNILKITHAGENDYRLLHRYYDTTPKNVFDIQLAAGFVGYKYPISFGKIVEKEIRVFLSKGYTVSDWESRPFNNKQLMYALNDVIYLEKLWQKLRKKLVSMNRLDWVEEEFKKMESPDYYYTDPNKEILQNSLILGLQQKEQAFLIRLYEWRRSEAERKNYSKEMILPAKYIGAIVRGTKAGKNALLNHRRLPNKLVENQWKNFSRLYEQEVSDNEREIIASIPPPVNDNNQEDTLIEMLSLIIRHICNEKSIAPDILIPRSSYKKMKVDPDYFDENIAKGWRKELLGDRMVEWLKNRDRLQLILEDDKFTLGYKN